MSLSAAGDGLFLFVEWDAEGRQSIRSIHSYGSATSRPDSPHYADLTAEYAADRHKPFWFERDEVENNQESRLELSYSP